MYSCCIETQFLSGSSGCGTEGEKWNMQDIKVVLAVMVVSISYGTKRNCCQNIDKFYVCICRMPKECGIPQLVSAVICAFDLSR